jgi:hypothetical protein
MLPHYGHKIPDMWLDLSAFSVMVEFAAIASLPVHTESAHAQANINFCKPARAGQPQHKFKRYCKRARLAA